jgi:hypothetical protein
VFRWDGASWNEEQVLTAGTASSVDDWFGTVVSVSGDLLAVGAPFDDRRGDDAGAAAVFAWNGGAWELETLLLPPARAAGDAFGVSLAMSNGTVAVGTPFRDVHGAVDQGMVYVFTP